MSYNAKNYTEQGGEVTHIGGKLIFDEGGSIAGFPGAENQETESPNSDTVAKVRTSLNNLLTKLKNAGIMIPDDWNVSVLACPTPASMPTSETAANSGHATVTIDGTEITITLTARSVNWPMQTTGRPGGSISGWALVFAQALDLSWA